MPPKGLWSWAERFGLYVEGIRDAGRLVKEFPLMRDYDAARGRILQQFRSPYNLYKSEISAGGSAISLELAVYLYFILEMTQAKCILDLGSGFSSYVFRVYQLSREFPVEAWSIDSDPVWLERTREYLKENGLKTERLFTWEEYTAAEPPVFDVILVDIRPISRRVQYLESFLGHLSGDGFLVADDCHKTHFRKPLIKKIKQSGTIWYSARKFTLDGYGRFSYLLRRRQT